MPSGEWLRTVHVSAWEERRPRGYRGKEATPGGHPGPWPGSLESFLPLDVGHKGHPRGAHIAATCSKWPKGALVRGCAQCGKGKENPRHLPATARDESLSRPSCRALLGTLTQHEQQAVTSPKWSRGALTSGHARRCRGRKKKNSWDQGQMGSILSRPQHWRSIGYSLSMWARPAPSSHWLITPPWRRPSSILPQPGASSGTSKSG